MNVTMPCLVVRFSTEKVEEIESLFYGRHCWKVFFEAVDLTDLKNAEVYEGDTAATLKGREYTYALAIQSPDNAAIQRLRRSLEGDDGFQSLADDTPFVEGSAAEGEPLPNAGRFDANDRLIVPEGRICNTKVVLDNLLEAKRESAEEDAVDGSRSEQIVGVASLAIRFDIDKARKKAGRQYAGYCWRVLFAAINPRDISNLCNWGEFFEGNCKSTSRGDETVYLIVLDMAKFTGLRQVQERLLKVEEFIEVAAAPIFQEGKELMGKLHSAGTLDNSGNISVPHGAKPGWHPDHAPAGKPSKRGHRALVLASLLIFALCGYFLLAL